MLIARSHPVNHANRKSTLWGVTPPFDAICVGESMALVTPDPPGPLAGSGPMRLDVAGAESTVASYLAMLGARVAWASRVGADPFGTLLCRRIASYGVDVCLVDVDPHAPTGVFFKDPAPERTTVYYYRAGSAASTLGPALLDRAEFTGARLVHLTGITPALSAGCADLVTEVLGRRAIAGATRSFDVNYRAALWSPQRAAPILAALANQADVVFVGLDEAERLWGTRTPDDVRSVVPSPHTLIVKDGGTGVTSYHPGGTTVEPALRVDVVEPVGAGDGFAAGYLFGLLNRLAEPARLRLGHLVAGAALRVTGDVGPLPPTAELLASAAVPILEATQ
jgi:2-dehydro-3-deoxygluconokinase